MNTTQTLERLMFKIGLVIITLAAVTNGCSAINKRFGLKDENALEEAIEHQIEKHTGISVDLSEDSPEPSLECERLD